MSPYDENVRYFVEDLIESEKLKDEDRKEILEDLLISLFDLFDPTTRKIANAMLEKKYMKVV